MKNRIPCLTLFLPCLIISILAEARPVLNVAPAELSLTAGLESSDTVQLVISNSGTSELSFELTDSMYVETYAYRDSNMADGPAYSWIDIYSLGSAVVLSDDDTSNTLQIGFNFPFYGSTYSQFRILSNGGISLSSGNLSYVNSSLPSYSAPSQTLFPFWDDLNPRQGGAIRYHSTAQRLVVSWLNVPFFGGDAWAYQAFQIILYPDGRILYQYKTLNGDLTSCTVGLQDDNLYGPFIQVAYNENYLENELAIEFVETAESGWIEYSPDQGSLAPGESQVVNVTASSVGLDAGNYSAELTVSGSDPENPSQTIPVSFDVLGDDSDADGLPDFWENEHFGGNTGADPAANPDGDDYTNEQEYCAGLDPNKADVFCINSLVATQNGVLEWNAVSGRVYSVYWTSNLVEGFQDTPLAVGITDGSFTDRMHSERGEGFYRLEVQVQP